LTADDILHPPKFQNISLHIKILPILGRIWVHVYPLFDIWDHSRHFMTVNLLSPAVMTCHDKI